MTDVKNRDAAIRKARRMALEYAAAALDQDLECIYGEAVFVACDAAAEADLDEGRLWAQESIRTRLLGIKSAALSKGEDS